mmetsp:Transcript_15137/g.28934  ORF Transcript_15137/g.28934 Transcript_15137/m.28934 type:complete len:222 (-) Transcript_15137:879-1544(-)
MAGRGAPMVCRFICGVLGAFGGLRLSSLLPFFFFFLSKSSSQGSLESVSLCLELPLPDFFVILSGSPCSLSSTSSLLLALFDFLDFLVSLSFLLPLFDLWFFDLCFEDFSEKSMVSSSAASFSLYFEGETKFLSDMPISFAMDRFICCFEGDTKFLSDVPRPAMEGFILCFEGDTKLLSDMPKRPSEDFIICCLDGEPPGDLNETFILSLLSGERATRAAS